ncbi:hypothetical protein [Salinilacihabitans rarus]|uniref:hypothetical protein n=1 Tax=Salinilacihabitans rarus TaxID=2961596 RepID=UPI0020C8F83B|nr:hypothetical protein [Salinilacihabitans rarus]
MDVTQVSLGLALVAVGAVTFVSPSVLDSTLSVSLFALAAVAVAGAALFVGVARNRALAG